MKASNARAQSHFGEAVALGRDTLAVGSSLETSGATGIDGNQSDTSAPVAGAAYVFGRAGLWTQQAYLKASVISNASFGYALALSGDNLVVGARSDSSGASGVNGNAADASASASGAAYLFTRAGALWSTRAYLKASNTEASATFGKAVALDGTVIAVGSPVESLGGEGVNGAIPLTRVAQRTSSADPARNGDRSSAIVRVGRGVRVARHAVRTSVRRPRANAQRTSPPANMRCRVRGWRSVAAALHFAAQHDDGLLRVAEDHHRVGQKEELVLHAREAGVHCASRR